MKLRFSINYRTEWGQHIAIELRYRAVDGTERHDHVVMLTQDGELWTAETAAVQSRRSPLTVLSYYYKVEDSEGKTLRREWNMVERTYSFDVSKNYIFDDQWREVPLPAHLYTNAYATTAGMNHDERVEPLPLPLFRKTILFRVSAPQLTAGQRLAVVGSHPAMGSWSPARYLPMEYAGQGEWMLTLNADALQMPVNYKYVVVDGQTQQLLAWEEGDDRELNETITDGEVRVCYGQQLRLSEKIWRAAGVCVPVFALRSEQSCGVGDFGDLVSFIDWAAEVGMKVVQLLPVNDTTRHHNWGDSDPYNITSAFRLHPHYLDLNQLGPLKNKQHMMAFRRRQRELNALAYSDYEAVDKVKGDYVKEYYEQQADHKVFPTLSDFVNHHLDAQLKAAADHARRRGVILMGDMPIGVCGDSEDAREHPEYFNLDMSTGTPPNASSRNGQNWGFPTYSWTPEMLKWQKRRISWLERYFDAIRLDHVQGFFAVWEIPSDQVYATMGHFSPSLPLTAGDIEYFGLPFRRDFLTHPFINDRIIDRVFGIHAQYVRDTFLDSKAYGLYDLKTEVNTQQKVRELFEGRSDEHSLWIRNGLYRLVANVLFLEDPLQKDMFHPRFMAWQEPVYDALSHEEQDAYMRLCNNYFYHRHDMYWGQTGYRRLSELFSESRLLVTAEDLGMMPGCVEPVLDSLRILSLELQRMPKQNGEEFGHVDANPVRSVATISTHDMQPLRLWWQQNPEQAQRYYITMMQKEGRAPEQLPAHLAEEIIARHLYCPSMLCVLSLQDWLAIDGELRSKNLREERINMPDDAYNRWQWRMHISIEELQKATGFNEKLRTMIKRSKR